MSRPASRRGTSNTNSRGSAADRRKRKQWLLDEYGDGTQASCHIRTSPKCLGVVDITTMWVDRYPVPGYLGGTYCRNNIRPACQHCQELQGGQIGSTNRWAKP